MAVERETCPVCGRKVGFDTYGRYRLYYHGPKAARCAGSDGLSVECKQRSEDFQRKRDAMTPEQRLMDGLRGAW